MSNENETKEQTGVVTKVKTETKKPKMYSVIMHNDDYTPMDFVVGILVKIFHKTNKEAQEIMLKVHQEGKAICGIYTFEIAESKTLKVNRFSRDSGHPLKCSFEPCED